MDGAKGAGAVGMFVDEVVTKQGSEGTLVYFTHYLYSMLQYYLPFGMSTSLCYPIVFFDKETQ